jgi:hypothetical protein
MFKDHDGLLCQVFFFESAEKALDKGQERVVRCTVNSLFVARQAFIYRRRAECLRHSGGRSPWYQTV